MTPLSYQIAVRKSSSRTLRPIPSAQDGIEFNNLDLKTNSTTYGSFCPIPLKKSSFCPGTSSSTEIFFTLPISFPILLRLTGSSVSSKFLHLVLYHNGISEMGAPSFPGCRLDRGGVGTRASSVSSQCPTPSASIWFHWPGAGAFAKQCNVAASGP